MKDFKFQNDKNSKKIAFCPFCKNKINLDLATSTNMSITFESEDNGIDIVYVHLEDVGANYNLTCKCGNYMYIIDGSLSSLIDAMLNSKIFSKYIANSVLYGGSFKSTKILNNHNCINSKYNLNVPNISLAVDLNDENYVEYLLSSIVIELDTYRVCFDKRYHNYDNSNSYFIDKINNNSYKNAVYCIFDISFGSAFCEKEYDEAMTVFNKFKDILAEKIRLDNESKA